MSDVLIVCVREDEAKAKALADMFRAAGFDIGNAPASSAEARQGGAGVIVWSQAAIRSRPFLDAAQRVIDAGKAAVACLIEPPPPSSIGYAESFDLSDWDGDPNDPALDPLFFTVDRLVNAARAASTPAAAAVGAGGGAHAAPPPPRSQSLRVVPKPAAPARAQQAGGEGLNAEAEYWRAIRDSRNPTDFLDYLAKYGPQGAFAEVADLRLKQLTAEEAPAAAPAPRPAPRAAAPRSEPPPARRRDVEPSLRHDPPPGPRRVEIAPPRRLPPEREYDRSDLRDPPRSGGGLRMLLLLAILAAIAGGVFFMRGGALPGPAFEQSAGGFDENGLDIRSAQPPADYADPASAPADALAPAEPDFAAASEPRNQAPEREPQRELPPPSTTYAGGPGGPVSLSPPASTDHADVNAAYSPPPASLPQGAPPSVVVPLQPAQAPPTAIRANAAPEQSQLRGPSGSVRWAQRPSARRMDELYPSRALRDGVGGRVQLDCTVQPDFSVACTIASETPPGLGFGRAALSAAAAYRAERALSDGAASVGARTRIGISFQAPQ